MNRKSIDGLKQLIMGENSVQDVYTAFQELIDEKLIEDNDDTQKAIRFYLNLPFFFKFWRKM